MRLLFLLVLVVLVVPAAADTVLLDANRSVVSYSTGAFDEAPGLAVEAVPSSGGISRDDPLYDEQGRCRWTVITPGQAPTKRAVPRWQAGAAPKRAAARALVREIDELRARIVAIEYWEANFAASTFSRQLELDAANARLSQLVNILSGQ